MQKINLAITGCLGRMGQQLIKSSKKNKNFNLVSLTENKIINKTISGIKPSLNTEDAFKKSDGFIPEIHKAAIKVAFEYNDKYKKFQTPENWLIQVAKLGNLQWPPSPEEMASYELGTQPSRKQRSPERLLRNIGHHPYRAKQPNGWSDHSDNWISPELLIRRLVYAKASYNFSKMENNKNAAYYESMVEKNFDNPSKIIKYINQKNRAVEKHTLLFNHPEFLKA